MANSTTTNKPRHDDVRFEGSDLNARWTFITGVGVLLGLFLTLGAIYLYYAYLSHERAITSPPALPIELHGNPLPPEPRLQSSPHLDLKALRANEDWRLSHYSWVDKTHDRVAIPIERAIEILAKQGIPPQKAPPNLTLSVPQAGTRETGFEGNVEREQQ